jgi:hypothetical protein
LQFQKVLAACLGPLAVIRPGFEWHLQLRCHQTQQWRERLLVYREHHAGIAHVAELHGEAQAVGRATPLPDDGQVGFTKRVVTDQLIFGVRQCQQAFSLGGGQD